ncbi:Sensor histidine kinase RcsC [uncultured Comamonas sp.]|nr:Sensor histidine kinase RcsC [uncultured Comamonas sp.]
MAAQTAAEEAVLPVLDDNLAFDFDLSVQEPEDDPQIKRIGDLRVSLPLYNVYLAEAEEWSQKLCDSLDDWQADVRHPQPEGAHAWAHSLAGSSATVGFTDLSRLARLLEHVLLHLQPLPDGQQARVPVLVAAAQEIRRLLHQFAAGFLPLPQEAVQTQLAQLLELPVLQERPAQESYAGPGLADGSDVDADADVDAVSVEATEAALPDVLSVQETEESVAEPASVETAGPAAASEPLAQALQAQHALDAALVRAMALEEEADEDIDVLDMVDAELFPIFEEEAQELLPTLSGALREWSAHPQRPQPRAVLLRALHTLKGSARLAGAMRLGEMAHRLESTLEQFDAESVTSEALEPLFARLDAMEAAFQLLRTVSEQQEAAAALEPVAPAPIAAAQPAALAAAALAVPAAPVAPVRGSQAMVRVRTQLLDRLVNDAGEVMITRSRLDARVGQIKGFLGELTSNLERLRYQLRDMEVQAESQMQSRQQLAKDSGADFDPLEFDRFTRVQELTRMLAESVNDVATVQRNLQREVTGAEDELLVQGRLSRDLQRDLLRTRMVEFDAVAERLYAVVRQASKDTGKQVKLEVLGGTIEMDRGVLERMAPAFEHLLRNCVAHGIEAPEARQAAGKAAAGQVSIRVQQSGNEVSVRFEDDGAGLNLERIRAKALENGLIDADTTVDAARAAQLVFMPGFSTAEQVSGVAGRGVGMDVVRSEVLALGGRIETSTQPGQGTVFELVLPLTTAMTQVVLLRMGDFVVGVPASLVEVVRRLPLPELEQAYQDGALAQADGSHLPFLWAGAVWRQSPRSTDSTGGKTRPVVIVNSASQRLALHVDEVLGSQEVVVKNLGPQLARLPGLAGMSLLPSGAVVLIYNPVALVAVHGEKIRALGQGLPAILDDAQARLLRQQSAAQDVQAGRPVVQAPLVMVVDDSITVRRVTQRLLQREGFRVSAAADGLQALEKLQDELPDVVLSDIEMPRMDGFDLLRNIRSSERLKDLPVIMITSRMAAKHRDLAMELGANHYLGKPYGDEELLGLIHGYTD